MSLRARLGEKTLGATKNATLPSYDRNAVSAGIVHLGVGAFHRAHQAVYVDKCLADGDLRWGIIGASLRSPDTRDALGPQDGLYALAVQDGDGEHLSVVGSLLELLVAPENPAALVSRMADPATRIVTLTVTEKAYLRTSGGGLDLENADVKADLADISAPRTVHGFIVAALRQRFAAGIAPFTVLCCDNLPANGATLRRLVLQFANAFDAALGQRIATEVAFPSTMVDRIVPATTDDDRARISQALSVDDAWPIKTEPFMQWVVEDRFTMGRPDWERFGVTMASDVGPYEDMKLRLLNGAHSGLAYLGVLAGLPTVAAAFGDADLRRFVDMLWGEAIPTLPSDAGLDPVTYTTALAERFSNPALRHLTAQIANDGSQKLSQRVLAGARENIRAGRRSNALMLVVAAWIAACEARGKSLEAKHFSDPLDGELAAIFARNSGTAETVRAVFAIAGFALPEKDDPLAAITTQHLETIRTSGVRAAISALRDAKFE